MFDFTLCNLPKGTFGLDEHSRAMMAFYIFSFSYDVVLTAGAEEISEKFAKFNARVVISAEGFIWPDKTLKVGLHSFFT